MTIAVCVSGIPRGGVGPDQNKNFSIQRNVSLLKRAFPSAVFHYATWKQHRVHIPQEYSPITFQEPTVEYHPYLDVAPISPRMKEVASKRSTRTTFKERTRHQTKQILAHAYLIDTLEDYDIVVRARWDTFVHPDADFGPYVAWANETGLPVGFAHLPPFETLPYIKELSETHPSREKFLFDQLIIHKKSCINTGLIYQLHDNKMLCPAEFGWYQVLSEPYGRKHRCVSGWVNADRNILPRFLKGLS